MRLADRLRQCEAEKEGRRCIWSVNHTIEHKTYIDGFATYWDNEEVNN